ncbi:hypothetical protein [Nocardia sp. AG03]|uniref:hypothetical protein n=1 Tax=Nocardia sp. AG03 TaxID=3025312 RepID=UPI0024186A54|nr:hypothetical protein [Nocardia sp. AG03]
MTTIPVSPEFWVEYNAFDFPSSIVSSGELTFRTDDLAHALFTTGRAPADRFRYGRASTWEWLHRASLIPAYLRRGHDGGLTRSRLAAELDRSELVGLSYALGTAMTAIFCDQVLGVSHLLHIDRYASTYGVDFSPGRKRADLIGRSPSGWVVAEARGRSRAMERALRTKLVEQKRTVRSIESTPPWLALGCVASFPNGRDMVVDAFDPEEPAEDAVVLDQLTRDKYLYAYYLPFLEAIEAGDRPARVSNTLVEEAHFGGFGVKVGILHEIADLVRDHASSGRTIGLGEQIDHCIDSARERGIEMLRDGSLVEADWADAMLGEQG